MCVISLTDKRTYPILPNILQTYGHTYLIFTSSGAQFEMYVTTICVKAEYWSSWAPSSPPSAGASQPSSLLLLWYL